MATMATLLTALRDALDEPESSLTDAETEGQWTNPMLRDYINKARKDIARKSETLQATTDIDVDADEQDHDLPADVVRVYRVEWSEDGNDQIYALEYRDFNVADSVWWTQQAITTSRPWMYTFWGAIGNVSLKLYPVPSENGTLKVFYYSLGTDLATDGSDDDDEVGFPGGWEDAGLMYAEYLALRRDRDPRWQEAKQLYDETLTALIDLSGHTDQAGEMTFYNPLGLPEWLTHG